MREGAGQASSLGADGLLKPQEKVLAFLVTKVCLSKLDPWECVPLAGMQNFGEIFVLVIPIFRATGWILCLPNQRSA